jgi:hypothetical protein
MQPHDTNSPQSVQQRSMVSGKRLLPAGEVGFARRPTDVGIEVDEEVFCDERVFAVANDWLVPTIVDSIIRNLMSAPEIKDHS